MTIVAIEGALTLATVPQFLREDSGVTDRVDLARCTRIDSAGAAYLLEKTRRARAHGQSLKVLNANEQVRQLLRFFELDEVLLLE